MSATYIGGPLDGQRVTGKRGTWRDETGAPVPTATGDQRFLGHHRHAGPPFYVHDDQADVYVHRDAWRAWRHTRHRPLVPSQPDTDRQP